MTKRYEFAMKLSEAKKLEEEYGSLNKAIHHLIYSTGAISDPRDGGTKIKNTRKRKKNRISSNVI